MEQYNVSFIKNCDKTLEKRLEIKAKGPPRPEIALTQKCTTKTKSFTRVFKPEQYLKTPWICGCEETKKLFCFPCLVFGAGASASAVPKTQNRIVGGTPTTVEQYPFMSNMQYGWWGIWWFQACGGSLITTTSVLSAAHCYHGDSAADWRVVLGTSLASSGGTTFTVSQLINHAQYSDRTLDYDIAIVKLSTPATLSASIATVSIAGANYNLADGTLVTTIGWGTLSSGGSSPEQLQHVDINVISQSICAERYAYLQSQPGYQGWPDITDRMLCAGILDVGGKDACQGDSGGPLAHNNNVIVGVVSWGFGCADRYYPGVNARVSSLSSWVVANA